ncbi:uncharacterized protein LOC107369241 [Tetranychus urticae]|nr:uncharacterized protein LOC107369241 [Tetranychus urticae]
MNGPVTNTEQPGISHLGVYQNCFNKFKDGYDTQNNGQNYFVGSNQVNFDSFSSEGYNDYINTPDAWNSSTAPNYNSYCNQSHQLNPTSPINVSVLQGSEGTGSWSTSFNRYMEERMDDAIGVLQKHAESCSYSPQIDCDVPSLSFPNPSQGNTLNVTPLSVQPHVLNNNKEEDFKPVKVIRKKKTNRKKEPNNNKKSASGYAHFFRERQARIKEENKTASFGEISKIVASEWEALSIDEKAVYKRKAENEKNNQFKDIALNHAMAVAGIK